MTDIASRSAIIVPLPAAEFVVAWQKRACPHKPSSGVPPHVTIIFPFIAPAQIDTRVLEAVAEVAADSTAFPVRLAETRRFREVLYIPPEPCEPFARLIDDFVSRYPEYPPYGGVYDEVIPHVTVAHGNSDELDAAAADVARSLPVTVEARELTILVEVEPESNRWQACRRFELGSGRCL